MSFNESKCKAITSKKFKVSFTYDLLPMAFVNFFFDWVLQVPGYKEINREMRDLSVEIDQRRRAMTSPDRDLVPYIHFNNSTVGYTTTSNHGNCWR